MSFYIHQKDPKDSDELESVCRTDSGLLEQFQITLWTVSHIFARKLD